MQRDVFQQQIRRIELSWGKDYSEEQMAFFWDELGHMSDFAFKRTVQRILDEHKARSLPIKSDFVEHSRGAATLQNATVRAENPARNWEITELDRRYGQMHQANIRAFLAGRVEREEFMRRIAEIGEAAGREQREGAARPLSEIEQEECAEEAQGLFAETRRMFGGI